MINLHVQAHKDSDPKHIRATARYLYALADAIDGGGGVNVVLADAPAPAQAPEPTPIPAKRTRAAKAESAPEPKPEPQPEPVVEAEDEDLFGDGDADEPKAVTADDLKAAARALMENKGPESVRKLMTDLGLSKTQKLNDLPESKWADFVKKATAA